MHDPGKVVLDLPVTLALGGDCLADIALLRCAPGCRPVASDPTASPTSDALAAGRCGGIGRLRPGRPGALPVRPVCGGIGYWAVRPPWWL